MFFKRKQKPNRITIFYCWQSDLPAINEMVENELKAQAYLLQEELDIPIIIDRDTRSDAGLSSVADSVFKKIDSADIFLCDISPVTSLEVKDPSGAIKSKLMPNSNVMLELGYAMRSMHYKRIIAVSNLTNFTGKRGNLPFDIIHKKHVPFTSRKDLKLGSELRKSIYFILDEGRKGSKGNSVWSNIFFFKTSWPFGCKKTIDSRIYTLMEKPEDFFSNRLSKAFPGVDGKKEYIFKDAVKRLEILFDYPMDSTSPLAIQENGKRYPIKTFKILNEYEVLIGIHQLLVNRISVHRISDKTSNQYIEIEDGKHYKICPDDTIADNDLIIDSDNIQEYAVFIDDKNGEHYISKQHHIDQALVDQNGKLFTLEGKSELRRIHLNGTKVFIVPNVDGKVDVTVNHSEKLLDI